MDDFDLFEGLKSGHRPSVKKIYDTLLPRIEYWITSNNGSKADAQDIFQETLETIILKIEKVHTSFEALVLLLSKRKWIDRLRRNKVYAKVRSDASDRLTDNETEGDLYIEEESSYLKFKILDETFASLSQTCQELMTLIRNENSVDTILKKMQFASANTMYRRKAACTERWSKLVKEHKLYSSYFE